MAVNRNAYTLVEMVASMAAASLLMGGLAASVFLSVEVFDRQPQTATEVQVAEVHATMMRDLQRATSFLQKTEAIAEFTVPDETGDDVEDVIKYEYDSNTGSLLLTAQGFTTTLLSNVQSGKFDFAERDVTGSSPAPTPYEENDWGLRWGGGAVVLESYASAASGDTTTLNIALPAEVQPGDLLIAAVMADKGEIPTPPGGDNWIQIDSATHGDTALALAVYWKIATSSEPASYAFSIFDDEDMFGFVMRFSGHDATDPFDDISSIDEGRSSSPNSPEVTTSVENALILRIGCFDDEDISSGNPGLSGHTAILMGSSQASGTTCSGGAGYLVQAEADDSGTSNFSLTASEQFLTITLAIQPE